MREEGVGMRVDSVGLRGDSLEFGSLISVYLGK